MCHNKKGWVNFSLTDKLKKQIYNLFSDFLGGIDINVYGSSYGIYDRLIINKHNLKVSYIAGQEHTSELRYIKRLIKRGE